MSSPQDAEHLIEELKRMLSFSKARALRDVARLRQNLLDQIEHDAQTRLNVCRQLLPPLKYDVKRNPGFNANPLGYIQACTALPKDMRFASNYSVMTFTIGSSVRLLYTHTLDFYDPFLFKYLAVSVTNPSGEEVKASHQDLENGSYMVSFVPTATGVHVVRVALYRQDIPGSPLEVHVAEDFLESVLCSSGRKPAVKK